MIDQDVAAQIQRLALELSDAGVAMHENPTSPHNIEHIETISRQLALVSQSLRRQEIIARSVSSARGQGSLAVQYDL